MIIRFQSKAGADVLMLGANGLQVLGLLGREVAPAGLIARADLAAAMTTLRQAVADDEATFAAHKAEALAAGAPAPQRKGVQLSQRIWPLLELMRLALAEATDVQWRTS